MSLPRSIGQTPSRAAARTRVERSDARISTDQPSAAGKCDASTIASEYGSSPVEQAALQARIRFGIAPASPSARQRGSTDSSRNSNCCGSRKKRVSFVEMQSSIAVRSPPIGRDVLVVRGEIAAARARAARRVRRPLTSAFFASER